MKNKKGVFVVIEGMDGAGKTTLAKNLCKAIENESIPFYYTREPGGTKISERIRDIIFSPEGSKMSMRAETLLFLASRAINVAESIIPNLEEGKLVICDRFFHSTNVYQGHTRAPELLKGIREANLFSIGEAIPDLTIYLRLPPEEAYNRKVIESKTDNWLDEQNFDFYKKIAKSYDKELKSTNWNCVILDATEEEDVLTKKALEQVLKVLKK